MRKLLNHVRNLLIFTLRYPWVMRGKNLHIQWSTTIWSPRKLVRFGDNVGIGPYCSIETDLIIGNSVLVGGFVGFLARDAHSPLLPGTTMFDSPRGDRHRIVVEDDVWIGYGAIILSGVTIGRGSIIAAGALVTKNVPRYSIVASPPATVLKQRFLPEQIEFHEAELRRQGVIRNPDKEQTH